MSEKRKLVSTAATWNVNSLRSLVKNRENNHLLSFLREFSPDILFLQETKLNPEHEDEFGALLQHVGYPHATLHFSSTKKGYAGTALYAKSTPLSVTRGFPKHPDFDEHGRVITAYYPGAVIVGVYTTNSGAGLKTIRIRLDKYEVYMREHMNELLIKENGARPVILCGDLNVAPNEIDIANPKGNLKSAGFTPEERAAFASFLDGHDDDETSESSEPAWVDVFRWKYPDLEGAYSYWSMRPGCRERNIGWRLDHFIVDAKSTGSVAECSILKDVKGSDHCPVLLELKDGGRFNSGKKSPSVKKKCGTANAGSIKSFFGVAEKSNGPKK